MTNVSEATNALRHRVSIIIPSRLQANPISTGYATPSLYLDLSLGGILRQTAEVDMEIIVGLDRGEKSRVPDRFLEKGKVPLLFVEAAESQASAVNEAFVHTTGDLLAVCEDDDLWDGNKLAYQIPFLDEFDLVTCNQRERDIQGNFLRYNDFPTPSGWLMKRATWEKLGGFDETFKYHVDTEWLGRANAAGLKRVHLIQDGHAGGSWLANVGRFSKVMKTDGVHEPLVHRMVNPDGGMAAIRKDPAAQAVSTREHAIMQERFSGVPW